MFLSVEELTAYYCNLYGFSYEFLETLPKYMFVKHNRTIFKRYMRDYKDLLRFERAENRARKRYWYFKERNNVEKMQYWLSKIKFLQDKRKRLTIKSAKLSKESGVETSGSPSC